MVAGTVVNLAESRVAQKVVERVASLVETRDHKLVKQLVLRQAEH